MRAVPIGTVLNLKTTALQKCAAVLVVKAHRLVYHSTLGLRVMKKKKKTVEGARRASTSRCRRAVES